jgi:hypothetical protein
MIFSGVDDLGDRLVVDAQIRRDAVQRRSLSVCGEDRRDHCRGLRGRTCIDQGLCECGVIRPRTRMLIWCGCGQECGVHTCGFRTRCVLIRAH